MACGVSDGASGDNESDNLLIGKSRLAPRAVQQLDAMTDNMIATYSSMGEAKRATGVAKSDICKCCNSGDRCRQIAGGFRWRYYADLSSKSSDRNSNHSAVDASQCSQSAIEPLMTTNCQSQNNERVEVERYTDTD